MKKILLYECEGIIGLEIKTILTDYEVISTRSLLIIPDMIERENFDLLIIDCVDIEQTLFVVRKMRSTSECPVIIMSAYPEKLIEDFKEFGCSIILLPFNRNDLIEKVKKLLK